MDAREALDLSSDLITWVGPLCNHFHCFIKHYRRNVDIGLSKCIGYAHINLNLCNLWNRKI